MPSLSHKSHTLDINDFCCVLVAPSPARLAYLISLHGAVSIVCGLLSSTRWMPSSVIRRESRPAALAPTDRQIGIEKKGNKNRDKTGIGMGIGIGIGIM